MKNNKVLPVLLSVGSRRRGASQGLNAGIDLLIDQAAFVL